MSNDSVFNNGWHHLREAECNVTHTVATVGSTIGSPLGMLSSHLHDVDERNFSKANCFRTWKLGKLVSRKVTEWALGRHFLGFNEEWIVPKWLLPASCNNPSSFALPACAVKQYGRRGNYLSSFNKHHPTAFSTTKLDICAHGNLFYSSMV